MLDRADFDDSTSYARAMFAGGFDVQDRWGRQRYGVGEDDLSRALTASVPVRSRRPVPTSEYLTTKEFWKRYTSVAAANFNGVVLSWMLTVSWGSLGLSGGAAWNAHKAFIELMRKWREERGLPPAWIWVRECGPKLGDHSHILISLHGTDEADFTAWARSAVETVTKRAPLSKAAGQPIETVDLSHGHAGRFRDVHAQWQLFQYVCKGLKPTAYTPIYDRPKGKLLARNLIHRRCENTGLVIGLRSGSSRALSTRRVSETASRAHWPEVMTKDGLPFYDDRYLAAGQLCEHLARLDI